MLTPEILPDVQRALADAGVDGWLLYDFRGLNPIGGDLMGLEGMTTRRVFAFIPTLGTPVAITHAIEQSQWKHWPSGWSREVYSSWRSLESNVRKLVSGKRVAMEYSAGDAVPYLDRVPAGVIEMVRASGASITSSGELVTRFYATWNDEHIASHEHASKIVSQVAQDALRRAGELAKSGKPATEYEIQQWILARFKEAKLFTDHGPNVSVGANAANPHYEPTAEASKTITSNSILLIDLWAREEGCPYADQTWMASLGEPSKEAMDIWNAIRDARDAAISFVETKIAAGEPLRGADVDDASRNIIESRGFGQYFTHRTGHSIDARDIHGSGPHIDNLESREERLIVPGVGFSIEPGIYIPGKIGMRTEVNMYITPKKAIVTPRDYQRDLMIV